MTLDLKNLDETTREYMLEEFSMDRERGTLYLSPLLTESGREEYPEILEEAIRHHDDGWLGSMLRAKNRMHLSIEDAPTKKVLPEELPVFEPDVLAGWEFNRYYVRGLCRRAIEEDVARLEIYRLQQGAFAHFVYKQPGMPQEATSEKISIGSQAAPGWLLQKLRLPPEGEMGTGIPGAPNSGLSVRLPEQESVSD
ncbi:MAG: hypothetical protein ACLFTB_07420 [Desulfovibrionales bacterium]